MPALLAFDFDGVVVNSIPALRESYFDFLRHYGCEGSESEFQSLNGPSVREIVSLLRKKYEIQAPSSTLLRDYYDRLNRAYAIAPPIESALDTLHKLKNLNVNMVLVTSSIRSSVVAFLEKHGIEEIFKCIFTSEDVSNSKPEPDIYLKVRAHFPQHDIWAIEDSDNGLRSAVSAGLKVVYFDPLSLGTKLKVDSRITAFEELPSFVQALNSGCCIVDRETRIEINVDDDYLLQISDQLDEAITNTWNDSLKKRPMSDDLILFYDSHVTSENGISVNAFWAPYRYFYVRFVAPYLDVGFGPLAVSGVCINSDKLLLVGERTDVTEYESVLEFVPSGSIGRAAINRGEVDYTFQLLKELSEEADVDRSCVSSIRNMGIVKDMEHNVVDLCCLLNICDGVTIPSINSQEYSQLSWLPMCDLRQDKLTPASRGILTMCEASGVL